MNLLKTSFLSGIATIIKMFSNLIINKIIAVYIGPTGIALIGQFQNILNTLVTLGSGGITAGVTKYVAQHVDNNQLKKRYISISLFITIFCSIFTGIVIFILKDWLTLKAFSDLKYRSIFIILSVSILFISLNNYLLALLNGLKKIKVYILINILSSLVALVLTTILTIKYTLYGALLSIVLVQSVVLVVTLVYVIKTKFINNIQLNLIGEKGIYKDFSQYSLMAIVSMVCIPINQLWIRNLIIDSESLIAAGHWEAMNKISSMYLLVITTALTTYYLPRLSEIRKVEELREEVKKSYRFILPFVLLSCVGIFILRDFIIELLFSKEFYGMRELFVFQLIGDFLKMSSWVLGFLMVARAMTKVFIITEIGSALLYLGLSHILINQFSVKGVTMAYATMYLIYLIWMVIIYKRIIKNWDRER
ncbi:O-antigen translocase [Bacillus cereus]|uniref:O-antigen translocase n=1 Tax=Bacillus cereus TaxID=1396 RepID=UPI00381B8FD8